MNASFNQRLISCGRGSDIFAPATGGVRCEAGDGACGRWAERLLGVNWGARFFPLDFAIKPTKEAYLCKMHPNGEITSFRRFETTCPDVPCEGGSSSRKTQCDRDCSEPWRFLFLAARCALLKIGNPKMNAAHGVSASLV